MLTIMLLLMSISCTEQQQLAESAMSSYQYGIRKEDIFFDEYIPERVSVIDGAYSSNKYYKTHEKNKAVKRYSDKIMKKCVANNK